MMLEYERELFDEFKRLESLCRDMFSCQHGVSEYISQMEHTPVYIQNQIPFWSEDYRTLKHLRWLRNQIAHETTATDCSLEDVEDLKDFYRRILSGQDPLAVSTKLKQKPQTTRQRPPSAQKNVLHSNRKQTYRNVSYSNNRKTHKSAFGFLYVCSVALALVFLIVIFIFHFLKASML